MTDRQSDTWLVEDLEQLVSLLGGSADSFTGQLCTLILKADPGHLDALRAGFPVEVMCVMGWRATAHQTARWWRRHIDEARRAMDAVRKAWSVPLPRREPGILIAMTNEQARRIVEGDVEIIDVRSSRRGQPPGDDRLEMLAALAGGDKMAFAPGALVCTSDTCGHPLPCTLTGAGLSGALAPLGDPNIRYGRWCSWMCLMRWAANESTVMEEVPEGH